MNRLPVAERREQLIEAALAVASRDGIDAATVRAVAAEAGVSLGVVHYCFQDKDELLRAMAHAITSANLQRSLGELPAEAADPLSVIEGVLDALWTGIRESRGPQLLSYELTTSSLRHAELNQVAIEQYRGQWAAAEQVLDLVERSARVGWSVPRSTLARSVVAVIDGFSLAWLVDGDSEAARTGLQGFGRYLATITVPAPVEADAAATLA
jgi:AcrR family transcriptional regulator